MDKRTLAEILFEMSMDMDWMDYEEAKDPAVNRLESELKKTDEALIWVLERIAMPFAIEKGVIS